MKKFMIVVAGGSGTRMGADIPKQFLLLGGRPVLMRTLENIYRIDAGISLILVLPRSQRDYWAELCEKYHFEVPVTLADGGATRFESVKNGLAMVDGDGLVAVHDGVRPFLTSSVVDACYSAAALHGAAVPVVAVHETVRHVVGGTSHTVARDEYRLVQTPQAFLSQVLISSYDCDYNEGFTDDASVVEAAGHPVTLVDGDRRNIKLTTPYDMLVGTALL